MKAELYHDNQAVLDSLIEVGVNLSSLDDRHRMLDVILHEARKLTRAQAGSLYIRYGCVLEFAAAQNDRLSDAQLGGNLLRKRVDVDGDSLAGFVARTGRAMNIPDAYHLPPGSPFRLDRSFDAATGYRTRSILALPLMRPEGECVGVLELINHLGDEQDVRPFPNSDCGGVASLASMAAVTIHNTLLQDQLKRAQLDCIIRLSMAAEFRDQDTAEHIRRISQTSAVIAAAMGLDRQRVELLQAASPMHDIGKIGIPDDILLKPASLTPQERRIVERHAQIGADILRDPPNGLIAMAREVAMTHHERWDGGGYPRRLAGEEIPLVGRIVGLADVFDALISRRVYKPAFDPARAREIIRRDTGRHFDPAVAAAFEDRLDVILAYYGQEFPVR
jgi:GAF domain-containing protein